MEAMSMPTEEEVNEFMSRLTKVTVKGSDEGSKNQIIRLSDDSPLSLGPAMEIKPDGGSLLVSVIQQPGQYFVGDEMMQLKPGDMIVHDIKEQKLLSPLRDLDVVMLDYIALLEWDDSPEPRVVQLVGRQGDAFVARDFDNNLIELSGDMWCRKVEKK